MGNYDNEIHVPYNKYEETTKESELSIPAVSAMICEYMSDSLLDAKISNRSTLLAIKLQLKIYNLKVLVQIYVNGCKIVNSILTVMIENKLLEGKGIVDFGVIVFVEVLYMDCF